MRCPPLTRRRGRRHSRSDARPHDGRDAGRSRRARHAELARVDAGFHFGPADGHPFRGRGFGVPRLAELLDRIRAVPFIVEIKGNRPEVADTVLAVIDEARAIDRVIVGGFSPGRARSRAAPEQECGDERVEGGGAIGAVPVVRPSQPQGPGLLALSGAVSVSRPSPLQTQLRARPSAGSTCPCRSGSSTTPTTCEP